ncbi:hypothetical protein IWQ62_002520, partial [Dispira parvispora]
MDDEFTRISSLHVLDYPNTNSLTLYQRLQTLGSSVTHIAGVYRHVGYTVRKQNMELAKSGKYPFPSNTRLSGLASGTYQRGSSSLNRTLSQKSPGIPLATATSFTGIVIQTQPTGRVEQPNRPVVVLQFAPRELKLKNIVVPKNAEVFDLNLPEWFPGRPLAARDLGVGRSQFSEILSNLMANEAKLRQEATVAKIPKRNELTEKLRSARRKYNSKINTEVYHHTLLQRYTNNSFRTAPSLIKLVSNGSLILIVYCKKDDDITYYEVI